MTIKPQIKEDVGYLYAGAHALVAMDGDIVFQIAAKYPQHKEPRLARRRFVYYWEKDFKENKWVRHGLCMTDDDGFLFDLKRFFNDHVDNKDLPSGLTPVTDWKIKKFDHVQRKWVENKWDFFGGIEDTIAFQKWLAHPKLSPATRKNQEDAAYFQNSTRIVRIDKEDQPVFRYHFLVPDEYLMKFRPGRERVFMFCPPDVIDPAQFKSGSSSNSASFSVANAGGSNRNIDFEFIPEPLPAWLTHKYYVKKGETVAVIAAKYGETVTRFHKQNTDILGNNPNNVKEGAALVVPGGPSANPFCTPADDGYVFETIGKDEILRVSQFPVKQQSGRTLDSARMVLAVNLEEHLSNLAFHTCLLDMEYQQIVESSKAFMEASGQIRQMGDLLELMYKFPGYKNRVPCPGSGMRSSDFNSSGGGLDALRVVGGKDSYNSVYYEGKVDATDEKLRDVLKAAISYQQYAEELAEAAWNDNNPVFRAGKDDVYREIDIVEAIVTDKQFYRRIDEWVGYEIYGKQKDDYPYRLKISCNALGQTASLKREAAPIIYRIIQDTFSLVLSLDLPQRPGKGKKDDSIAEAFYKTAVAAFESQLEIAYMQLDAMHNVSEGVMKAAAGAGLVPGDIGPADLKQKYLLSPEYAKEEATVLQIVFMDVACKELLASADSYFQAVLTSAARTRSSAILAAINFKRSSQAAFAHIRVGAGALFYKGVDPKSISLSLEQGVTEYARARQATLVKVQAKKQLAQTYKKGYGEAPQSISHVASAVGAAFTLYDIGLFVAKYSDNQQEVSVQDWIGLTRTLHGGGVTLTGFDFKWLNKYRMLNTIGEKTSKFLKGVAPVFLWYDTITFSFDAWNFYEEGEELFAAMRAGQAAFSLVGATLALTIGLNAVPVAGTLIAAGVVLTGVAIEIMKSARKGIENTIKDTRGQLMKLPLFKGEVSTFSTEAQYILYNSLTIVAIGNQRYQAMTPVLKKWDEIRKLDSAISYWNLHMIKAGSVLMAQGYATEQTAFICMEVQEAGGLRQMERDWIRYFAEEETYVEKNNRSQYAATAANGPIKREQDENLFSNSFKESGGKLEIIALPPRMSTQGLF